MKSIETFQQIGHKYPDFKPPSPENPTRPLRVSYTLRDRFYRSFF